LRPSKTDLQQKNIIKTGIDYVIRWKGRSTDNGRPIKFCPKTNAIEILFKKKTS
jgi:hypothetical protein